MKKLRYQFYATLLDAFQNYLNSSLIYQEYWGFSDDPNISEDEFEQQQKQSLLDRINRIPFVSEKADRGTAFNEVIDCINENRSSEIMNFESDEKKNSITVNFKEQTFVFPLDLCKEFSNYFKESASQVYNEGILSTQYGEVLLYGYIDKLMPSSINDIKLTSKYQAGKFKRNWQHIVYPYNLNYSGNNVSDFEYNIVVVNKDKYSIYKEYYNYQPERDILRLKNHVEHFIEFIESNRANITDKKIFNEL